MEDEDLEGRVMDVWGISGDQEVSNNDETLKRTSSVLTDTSKTTKISYNDVKIKDSNEDKCSSDVSDDSPIKNAIIDSTRAKIAFKGFKKRILAQTQENHISTLRLNHRENHRSSNKKIREKRTTIDGKRGKITEYAQYLGLQPASNKTNCTNCETINLCSQSMIKEHRCTCSSGTMTQSTGRASPGTSDSLVTAATTATTTTNSLTANSPNNFRITRKVYLCAACGTYFENWNLFLHMREIHKRHICLFCLGMFGQAERLSCHLTKKHSVPETEFTSVEDFYNVFKGSCYLICCTCEKVFSETDNFYNHFCSSVQKGRLNSTNEICSLCRQTSNNHAITCSLAQTENNDCEQSNRIDLPDVPEIPIKPPDEKPPVKGTSKRNVKNNRLKRPEESALMLYQQKVEELQARKMSIKSLREQRDESSPENIESSSVSTLETATTTTTTTTATPTTTTMMINTTENESSSLHRDTVSETIMEVSQLTEDSRLEQAKFHDTSEIHDVNRTIAAKTSLSPSHSISSSSLASPVRHLEIASCYDSVTETIMEVSRGLNDIEIETSNDDDDNDNHRYGKNETSSRGSDADALIMDDTALTDNDEESANGKENYDDRLKNLLSRPKNERRRKRRKIMRRRDVETSLENLDSDEIASSSDDEKNDRTKERSISESCSSPEKESQRSVSFTTVNTTDRSLVIKICTNRNAQFTVTRSTNNTSENCNENHETSRESEENNNGEDSASDGKLSNHSERGDRDSVNSRHEDEDDDQSDRENTKLTIVGKPEGESLNDPVEESTEINETREDFHVDVEENDEKENFVDTIKLENTENNEIDASTIDNEMMEIRENSEKIKQEENDGIILAAEDVPSIDLNVEGILENAKIEDLLKRCIKAASSLCVYCNHARQIAVNGKQLGLHVLAEHRFQPQHPAIIIKREQFIAILKKSLNDIENIFFNLDSYDSNNGTYNIPIPRLFECFHCRYHSLVHKDIYLHNRKLHQKTILICIMCKSTFYSYSELLCHLCPGVYSPNANVTYRCCLCPVSNLPSAFRLMVHLRKRHHSCDVCLESTGNQQRLSNHVWKHKLHHLCYRCGIAYRNKPDITKHLFWKHGTESVLCKKCLQKKWPHVYHFCIPPTAFVCEECTSTFSRAVALKVHKRLHSGDRPYGCGECEERFISRRLMMKHETSHREPEIVVSDIVKPEIPPEVEKTGVENTTLETATTVATETKEIETLQAETESEAIEPPIEIKETKEPVKKVVDVYDLPPLNLSSDSDSDTEETPSTEVTKKDQPEVKTTSEEEVKVGTSENQEISSLPEKITSPPEQRENVVDIELDDEEKKEEAQIMDGIWDNFKSYAASLGQDSTTIELTNEEKKANEIDCEFLRKIILADHDYCVVYPDKSGEEPKEEVAKIEDNCGTMEGEHDYGHKIVKSPSTGSAVLNCDSDTNTATKRKKEKSPKKKKRNDGSTSSSDSSSDSDSSSCSCGTNCSCSSSTSGSSSSSSSSSDSDSSASGSSPRKQTVRKERRRDKEKESATTEDQKDSIKPEIEEKIELPTAPEENECKELATQNETVETKVEICERPPSPQIIFRESDLDTDETETDEDFYDEHPQQLANKLLAEKRNQLMLLAAVAPAATEITPISVTPNNLNGILENDATNTNSLEVSTPMSIDETNRPNSTPIATTRKRVKTKKRKKSDRGKQNKNATSATNIVPTTPTVESIKLNIPKSFYQKRNNKKSLITVMPSRSSTPSIINSSSQSEMIPQKFINDANQTGISGARSGGSVSENDNKRSSKRKRVPKRFYGDSSDEEHQQQQQQQQQQLNYQHYNQPSMKWRKVEAAPPVVPPISIKTTTPPVAIPANQNYGTKSVTLRLSGFDQPLERVVPMITGVSATESEEQAESSSADSSEAEQTNVPEVPPQIQRPPVQQHPTIVGPSIISHPPIVPGTNPSLGPERSVNLYCYCQCPYDEVSEMIACDGNDCHIEWFHFECVGIMVPPKGKWYCPDCRRKDSSLTNDDCPE